MAKNNENKAPLTKKQKNWIYTGIFFSIVIMLFILNNIESGPETGPYPPYYIDSQKQKLSLATFKGKVVLLDFWTTWSVDCRKTIPDFINLKEVYKDQDFELIGINLDAVTQGGITFSEVIPFINNYKINYPVVVGTDRTMNSYGGIKTIPTSVLIDKDGNIFERFEGAVDLNIISKKIDEALSGNTAKEKIPAAEFNLRRIN